MISVDDPVKTQKLIEDFIEFLISTNNENLHHASNRELSKISSHKIFKIEILNLKHIFLILSIVVNFCGTFQHKQAFYLFLL